MTTSSRSDNGEKRGAGIRAHLRQVPLFAGLDGAALDALALRCRRRTFAAGAALFHEGEPGQTLYVIVRGRVNIEKMSERGGEGAVHLALRGPGDIIGEMALLADRPRSADAITDTECEVLALDRAEFLRCVEEEPSVARQVLACLSERLAEAADERAGRQGRDALGRLAAFLLRAMETDGEPADPAGHGDGTRITARWTQRELAERIGATRETVNRAMARLVQAGAVRQEPSRGGGLVITDAAKLRRYAAG